MTDHIDQSFVDFLMEYYQPIEQLESNTVITTQNISDTAELNGFLFTIIDVNKHLLFIGFQKFDMPGFSDKVWLIRERIQV